MTYETLKALHIIFVVTWFAGLFYIVRLFVYHREAQEKNDEKSLVLIEQYTIMEKRLWYGITWPSALLTLFFGGSLIKFFLPLSTQAWLHIKLTLVALLFLYHFVCGSQMKKLQSGQYKKSSQFFRVWNEIATLFLVAIVFIVIYKDTLDMLKALLIFVGFSAVLFLCIKVYKNIRS